ncbi:T9SS type A sorting domain-containing protein [uncultured Aquimarina sp.]|uniref:DUF7619 domain-containing protein n=1 Tax=uncultured Aquimarina sp. TaxID=575652 RepID=UPI00260F1F18|nr:T9SS type A sorting domain-containing protein [uncultured Aquimarina sp.]
MKLNYSVLFIILSVGFSFGQTPSNDDIQNATIIDGLPFVDQFVRTDLATTSSGGGMNNCDFSNVLTRVYYKYLPASNESIMIGITDNGINSIVLAYESDTTDATSDSDLTLVTGLDCAAGNSIELELIAGKTYYFVISNPNSATHIIAISNTENDIINIPDSNLKSALINGDIIELDQDPNSSHFIGGIDEIIDADLNNDGEIQESEALFVTYLDVSSEFSAPENEKISDLTGIEYFTNLEYLDVSNNNISNLGILDGSSLRTLICYSNVLTNINVSGFSNLENFLCGGNQLTTIDVSQNLMLRELEVGSNQLLDIDVTQNTLLTSLRFGDDNIAQIDVTQNPELLFLECVSSKLTHIDVTQNTKLNHLWLSRNQISDIDISKNTALEILWISRNDLNHIDLSNNLELKQLSIWENNLTEIDISNNILLERLFISSNDLSNISVSNNTKLREFDCANMQLSELDVTQNADLESLNCSNNQLTLLDVSQNLKLNDFVCHTNQLTSLDVTQNLDLQTLRLGTNPIQEIDVSQNQLLSNFNSFGTSIINLDLSNNPNLSIVSVGNNYNLQSVNLKNGNNQNITSENFYALDSPNLQTICVDDLDYAVNNFTNKEPLTFFVDNCSQNSINYNVIEGDIVFDEFLDGCDPTDLFTPNIKVTTSDGTNEFSTFTNNKGFYRLFLGDNTYDTSVSMLPDFVEASPITKNTIFSGFGNTEVIDFCLVSNTSNISDVEILVFPIAEARPGFDAEYQVVYQNKGITTLDGTITFQFDAGKQSFISSIPTETDVFSNSITFDYANLKPFEIRTVDIKMSTFAPPSVNDGDVLTFTSSITTNQVDQIPDDNFYTIEQTVVNSYDPNDKLVLQGAEIFVEQASDYLDYVIRFQNTGTASAINVRITDRLNENLDWSTIQPLSASHNYRTQITNGDFVEFIFDDINLPAEQDDLNGSNGFVAFRIKPKDGIAVGDIITGNANIYFDFNVPIITNVVSTEVIELLDIEEFTEETSFFTIHPNPVVDYIHIESKSLITSVVVFDINGRILKNIKSNNQSAKLQLNINDLDKGVYFFQIESSSKKKVFKISKN